MRFGRMTFMAELSLSVPAYDASIGVVAEFLLDVVTVSH